MVPVKNQSHFFKSEKKLIYEGFKRELLAFQAVLVQRKLLIVEILEVVLTENHFWGNWKFFNGENFNLT